MNREQAIEWLIDDDLGLIQQGAAYGDFEYIAGLLRDGFDGYRSYKLEDLYREVLERVPAGELRNNLTRYIAENFA